MLYREIEEAVAFIAAYFYYKLPRRQVDVFSERLANALLRHCRSQKGFEEGCNSRCARSREIVIEINAHGRIAIVIIEAASIFNISLQQVSALLPNNVRLHITADSVCYSVRSSRICLYRADGNMYHFHRGAHHTKMRPPLTLTNEDDEHLRTFTLISNETFPRRRYYTKHKKDVAFPMANTESAKDSGRTERAAYFRRNFQQLPGPERSARLHNGGNGTTCTSSSKYDPIWDKAVQKFIPAENRITSSAIMHNRASANASYLNLESKSAGTSDTANEREIPRMRSPCDDSHCSLTRDNRTNELSRFEIVHGHTNNVCIRCKSEAIAGTEQMCTNDTLSIQWRKAVSNRKLKPSSKSCRKPSCQRYIRRINATHPVNPSETRSEQWKEVAHECKSTSIVKEEPYRSRTQLVDGIQSDIAKDADMSRNFVTDDILRSLGVFAGDNLVRVTLLQETLAHLPLVHPH